MQHAKWSNVACVDGIKLIAFMYCLMSWQLVLFVYDYFKIVMIHKQACEYARSVK